MQNQQNQFLMKNVCNVNAKINYEPKENAKSKIKFLTRDFSKLNAKIKLRTKGKCKINKNDF